MCGLPSVLSELVLEILRWRLVRDEGLCTGLHAEAFL